MLPDGFLTTILTSAGSLIFLALPMTFTMPTVDLKSIPIPYMQCFLTLSTNLCSPS